jgi:hypothetical protein
MTITVARARADALEARRAELLTIKEFSFICRRNEEWVRELCRQHRLPGAIKIGGTWMIDIAQVFISGRSAADLVITSIPTA